MSDVTIEQWENNPPTELDHDAAERLRHAADGYDIMDDYFIATGREDLAEGDALQRDLRAIADLIDGLGTS